MLCETARHHLQCDNAITPFTFPAVGKQHTHRSFSCGLYSLTISNPHCTFTAKLHCSPFLLLYSLCHSLCHSTEHSLCTHKKELLVGNCKWWGWRYSTSEQEKCQNKSSTAASMLEQAIEAELPHHWQWSRPSSLVEFPTGHLPKTEQTSLEVSWYTCRKFNLGEALKHIRECGNMSALQRLFRNYSMSMFYTAKYDVIDKFWDS